MNTVLKPIAAVLALSAAASYGPPAFAAKTPVTSVPREVHFSGTDRNWFNPANWSTGRVPGPNDCVVLDGNDDVVIDPALSGGAPARAHDVRVIIIAALEARPGAVLETSDTSTLASTARIVLRGSAWIGGDIEVLPGRAGDRRNYHGGVWLNPTPKSKRIVVLQSSFTSVFGLGGRTPSSVARDAAGRLQVTNGYGTYSTATAETTTIAGNLWLNLHYGFRPAAGDRFTIVNSTRSSSGQFNGLPEGALAACSADGVGLSISYRGGDGNDVELIADRASPEACRAPTVQPLFEISDKLAIDDPGIAQTREHILLARQVGVPSY